MIFVCAVENTVLFLAFLALGTLVDEVLLDELLELLEKKHTLRICDGQGTERIETWVLGITSAL